MSLQNAATRQGAASLGCDGKYDWVVTSGGIHTCVCSDLESNSPYTQSRIPAYPHPNCRCTVVPRLRDTRKLVADLKKWTEGGDIGYIDKWYKDYYKE